MKSNKLKLAVVAAAIAAGLSLGTVGCKPSGDQSAAGMTATPTPTPTPVPAK